LCHEQWSRIVLRSCDGERSASGRLPDVLLVVIVFADDSHLVGDKVRRVEANTELANHRDVATGLESLHEGLGARSRDSPKIVDELRLGHANTGVLDRNRVVALVRDNPDEQIWLRLQLIGIGN